MKIILIQPEMKNDFGKNMYKWMYAHAPYGLQLLAACTPQKHEIKIIDECIGESIDFNEKADLIGVSAMTAQVGRAYEIAKEFKDRGQKVIMGGYHPSIMPEEALKYCDCVCIGEGEGIWGTIIEDLEKGELKQIYRSDTLIDLAKVPWPRRDILNRKKYPIFNIIMTSRGCPFKCSFCSLIKFFGYSYRFRPVEDIAAEIKMIKDKGELTGNMVYFMDDNIVGNIEYAKSLFRALIPLKVRWISQASITIAKDDELLSLAKESGCYWLQIGFESVSNKSLKEANKKIGSHEIYEEGIRKIHAKKIKIYGAFIFGFDSDDKNVFDDTINFIEKTNMEFATFSILTPLPGSEIYEQFDKDGRLLHKDWKYYDIEHVVFKPQNMTPEELQQGFYDAHKKLFKWTSIIKRSFGSKTGGIISAIFFNWVLRYLVKYMSKEVYKPDSSFKGY